MNPFSTINVEGEIPGFLEWIKDQMSESYYKKNIAVYAQHLRLLANPLRFTQAINLKTPRAKTHIS